MTLIDKLSTSYQYVCDNSKNVTINYTKIDEMINRIEGSLATHWLNSNPFGLMDLDANSLIDFLLIYHTIGDYCFWGNPKWEIDTDLGVMDGSFAIMYLSLSKFKQNHNFDMTFAEFREFLKGNVVIPLLENRYENLVKMSDFLRRNKKTFHELIRGMNSDTELFEYIITNLDYFQDVSKYDQKDILFYKRAQLLTSDILHVKEKKVGISVDYSHLIGCADYKIPQVMRCYGMLEFSNELAKKVDGGIELEEGSKDEVEIRANALKVIDYIYRKTGMRYPRMNTNDFIWLLGQDKAKMTKPYHKTLTSHY
jgi:hypothetical protein